MLTIDWKERLTMDTISFFENKLPKQNYDFEIIFNAYPARVNGKIPSEVIAFVAQVLLQKIGRNHEQYIPFFNYLWEKKGEYGKLAYLYIMNKLISKKTQIYFPLVEAAMKSAPAHDVMLIMDKIFLPLLKKKCADYLPILLSWIEDPNETLRKQSLNLILKFIKREPEQIPPVLSHFQKHWNYSTEKYPQNQIQFLKALAKIDKDMYLSIYQENGSTREPQTVEILCGAITATDTTLKPIIENWTHSGNARVKKAALSAMKLLSRNK